MRVTHIPQAMHRSRVTHIRFDQNPSPLSVCSYTLSFFVYTCPNRHEMILHQCNKTVMTVSTWKEVAANVPSTPLSSHAACHAHSSPWTSWTPYRQHTPRIIKEVCQWRCTKFTSTNKTGSFHGAPNETPSQAPSPTPSQTSSQTPILVESADSACWLTQDNKQHRVMLPSTWK